MEKAESGSRERGGTGRLPPRVFSNCPRIFVGIPGDANGLYAPSGRDRLWLDWICWLLGI